MAGLEIPSRQPILLQTAEDTSCYSAYEEWIMPVRTTDISKLQLKIQPCESAVNLIDNGLFYDITGTQAADFDAPIEFGTGRGFWVNTNGGILFIDNQDAGSSSINSVNIFTSNNVISAGYFKLILDVAAVTSYASSQMQIYTDSATIKTIAISDLNVGENIIYFWYNGSDDELKFTFVLNSTNNVDRVSFYNFQLYRMPYEVAFGIVNQTTGGTTVYRANSYLSPSTTTSDQFTLLDEWLTVFIDWSTLKLTAGCYKICLYDPCLNTNSQLFVANQYLDELQAEWTLIGGATWQRTFIDFPDCSAGTPPKATSDSNLKLDVLYIVKVDLGTVDGNLTLTVGSGSSTDDFTLTAGDSNTTKNTIIIGDDAAFFMTGVSIGAVGVQIKRVQVYMSNTSDYTCNKESNQLNLGTHSCTQEVKMCHDEEDFGGFKFSGTGFTLQFRVDGLLTLGEDAFQYLNRIVSKNSLGANRNIYGWLETYYDYKIDAVPEQIAKTLALAPLIDHLYIDDTEYIVPETEKPELARLPGLDNLYSFVMTIKEKTENIVNRALTDEGIGCLDETLQCLLDPQTDLCLIDPVTGDPVLSYE